MTISRHAEQRAKERRISLGDIINTLTHGHIKLTKRNTWKYTYNNICVIVNKNKTKIVTVHFA